MIFAFSLLSQTIQAQVNAKGIKDQGVKSHTHQNGCCQYKMLYLGGSYNSAKSSSSQRVFGNYSGNTMGLNLDYSQTIFRKPGFSVGFNLGGQYFTGSGDTFGSTLPKPYLVTAQISSEASGTTNVKNSGYFIGIGPQLNIHFANHFIFSPIFQVGYLGVSQSKFKATQTTLMQGFALPNYTKSYDLISQTETKTNGLGFIPKARLTYMINKNIGIWAEASYLLGPTVKNSLTTFTPQGQPNAQGAYTIQQMDAGNYTTVVNESKYSTVGLNMGLAFGFGGNTNRNIHQYPGGGHAVVEKEILRPKSCFAKANLVVDKFSCCNDTLVIQGHFDINKSGNTTIDNVTITKITDGKGYGIKNSLVLPSIIKTKSNTKNYDYTYEFKIDGKNCKNDLVIEYVVNATCTINGLKNAIEGIETKTISEKDIPCCSCDKANENLDDKTERNIHQYPGGGHAVVANENTRTKACFAAATLITNKFKCCENQILIEGFFDVNNAVNTVVNNITISKVTDNKGNNIKNTLTLPFKINPKGISKGYKFPIEFKIDNSACKNDVVIEYVINATCTTNKIAKSVQYTGSKTILEKELPCCNCENASLSDNNEPKCENNPIVNGDFLDTGIISGIMPTGKLPKWYKAYGSPKVIASQGCLDNGYVELSGNKLTGSAISQKLDYKIISGKKYKVTVAVKYNKQQLDYGKIRVVAFNGVLPVGNIHPNPQSDIAIIGRSPQVHDCGDWSFIEFPIWKANKNFDNIAINAFTNDDAVSSTVLIDNVSFCETVESDCLELEVDAAGNPLVLANLGTVPSTFTCTTFDDDDDYFNGNLTDLYGYNGTFDMYEQNFSESSEKCFNIGGELPKEVINYNCDNELQAEGITETCAEIETLINSVQNIPQENHDYPLIAPLTYYSPAECKLNNLKGQMAFGGRDIIYVHGLEMSNIIDRAKGVKGAMTSWPDKTEFYGNGYYKGVAENNWKNHITYYKDGFQGHYANRYLIVCYNSSQDAETAANSIMSQIRDAMQTGEGVVVDGGDLRIKVDANGKPLTNEKGFHIAECFGKEYVIISHSTGGLVADIMLSVANKTKNSGVEQSKYGNLGYISDRCSGHIAMHSAVSGSNVAAVAVAAVPKAASILSATSLIAKTFTTLQHYSSFGVYDFSTVSLSDLSTMVTNINSFIKSTILVDLSPKVTYARWSSIINDISVPVLTISGNHPTGTPLTTATKLFLKGLDDGVVNTESSSGRNQINPSIFSTFEATKNRRVFDMGIPTTRASWFYIDQHKPSSDLFYCNSSPYLSATGMVEPWSNISINPQYNNHYTFLQASDQHMMPDDKMTCFISGNYPNTKDYFKSYNNEEELVVNDKNLYNNGTINPVLINEMGEFVKDKTKNFPKFTVKIVRKGLMIYPKICCTWIPRIIWKRYYHRLINPKLLDMDYAYKYLFPN